MIDRLDILLTKIFATCLARWIAVRVLHIPPDKCNRCYTRVRWAQFLVWSTTWLDWILHDKRIDWKVRANPLPDGFSLGSMQAVGSSLSASSPTPDEKTPLPETIAAIVETAVMYNPEAPVWPAWWPPAAKEQADRLYLLGSRSYYAEW